MSSDCLSDTLTPTLPRVSSLAARAQRGTGGHQDSPPLPREHAAVGPLHPTIGGITEVGRRRYVGEHKSAGGRNGTQHPAPRRAQQCKDTSCSGPEAVGRRPGAGYSHHGASPSASWDPAISR